MNIDLCRAETLKQVLLADLFRCVLERFDVKEELPGRQARHLWNYIVNNEAEVDGNRLEYSRIVQYTPNNQLVTHDLVKYSRGTCTAFHVPRWVCGFNGY